MGIYVLAWLQNSHDTEGLEAYIIKRDCLIVAKNPVVICEKAVAGVVGQGGGQDKRAYPQFFSLFQKVPEAECKARRG